MTAKPHKLALDKPRHEDWFNASTYNHGIRFRRKSVTTT